MDQALAVMLESAKENDYTILITADHGNCEEMLNDEGDTLTAHTTNSVPFILIDDEIKKLESETGILADIAPTMLKLLEIKQPVEMTGKSLV